MATIAKALPAGKSGSIQPAPTRTGKRKAEPGDVWWVSEEWSDARRDMIVRRSWVESRRNEGYPVDEFAPPSSRELLIEGLRLEPQNGQNRATHGAMMAFVMREKKRRERVFMHAMIHCQPFIGWPVRVTLTRVAPNEVDDDNLRSMFKRVRDALCEALGFRDDRQRDGYLAWDYAQEKGGSRADNARGVAAIHHVKVRIDVLR